MRHDALISGAAMAVLLVSGCSNTLLLRLVHEDSEWRDALNERMYAAEFREAIRLDFRHAVPAETWATKFTSLQSELRRRTGTHGDLPVYLSSAAASAMYPGWPQPWSVGTTGPPDQQLTVREHLSITCRANGLSIRITRRGVLIDLVGKGSGSALKN